MLTSRRKIVVRRDERGSAEQSAAVSVTNLEETIRTLSDQTPDLFVPDESAYYTARRTSCCPKEPLASHTDVQTKEKIRERRTLEFDSSDESQEEDSMPISHTAVFWKKMKCSAAVEPRNERTKKDGKIRQKMTKDGKRKTTKHSKRRQNTTKDSKRQQKTANFAFAVFCSLLSSFNCCLLSSFAVFCHLLSSFHC